MAGRGPNYVVVPNDWENLEYIIADLSSRILNEDFSLSDYSRFAFKTITGITNDVVADSRDDSLTLSSANNILGIVGTTATDTITFTIDQSNIDHGSIGGLGDDDHTQYLLVDGTRDLGGDWGLGGFDVTNGGTIQIKRLLAGGVQ